MAKVLKLAIKNDEQFVKAGKTGVSQFKSGKRNLWNVALYALAHYAKCGDHSKINQALTWHIDAGVGATYFRVWVETYSDQVYDREQKKFVRDEENKRADRANVEEASMENYWIGVARKDQDDLEYDATMLNKELHKIVTKFGKRKAKDASAGETLEYWKRQLNAKAPEVTLNA
tara:strand:- start:882 stop:1403 length:522 start_codon:yes stop_codon:yes gene_type:complete